MSDQETATVEQPTETQIDEAQDAVSEANDTPSAESLSSADDASPQSAVDTSTEDDNQADSIFDLEPRQQFTGKVKNVTSFGAFVDIGLPQDGLVHISELSKKKVDKVTDVVNVGQEIDVWVKKVDQKRGRISLTMVKPVKWRLRDIEEGAEFEGVVTRLESYGAFVDIDSERDGLVHISQVTHEYINHPQDALAVGDPVNVKVLKVNRKKRQIDLSMKALVEPPPKEDDVKPVQQEVANEPVVVAEDGPAPTAMAMALAAMQDRNRSDKRDAAVEKDNDRHRKEIDDIIARTLAAKE